jgi:peptidoglycan/xylan/chitin deacetylase (PgdA/CDA1 family)
MSTFNGWPKPSDGPDRDFVGYGRRLPKVRWPNGARVAISLCLNYEEGSERSYPAGDKVNDASGENSRVFPAGVRNLATESIFEYGSRVGVFRLLRMFDDLGVKCTAFAAAVALKINREAADWMVESGHEICSHGWRWSEQWTMSREEEREKILWAIDLFKEVTGQRPDGWYSRYGASLNTRELLVEEGFLYDSDAYNDDLPYFTEVKGRKHLVLPYSMIYNDGRYQSGQFGGPDDFFALMRRAFDYLWEEGATHPKMMSIGLHPRWIGQAGRASALKQFIEYAQQRGDVWFARRNEIARWWIDHHASFEHGPEWR